MQEIFDLNVYEKGLMIRENENLGESKNNYS